MENILGFVIIIITLIINILAIILLTYILIYLVWNECRLRDINLLLVINTYIPVFLYSIGNITMNTRVVLGDTNVYITPDSLDCQIFGFIYLYVVIWLFGSFSVQAFIRMLNIVFPTRTQLHSFMAVMIFIVVTCLIFLLLHIPTIFLQVITYEPGEYQCLVNLHAWKGNIYMMITNYTIPITVVAASYFRVIKYMQASTLRNQQHRKRAIVRDFAVLQRIIIIIGTLIVLGLPSAVFWILGLITGEMHPLAFRLQAMFIAFDSLFLTFAVVLTNPQVKKLVPLFNICRRNRDTVVHPQQQLIVLPTRTL